MDSETASGRLRSLFGESRFREDNETLQLYASSLSGTHVQPACVVFPVTEQEIVSLFEIAASSCLCIYPISRGKNYGYGEAQGTGAGQIIADLSMMNRIIEVNETLAYATIQPGVSQEALYQFLKQHNSRLQLDVTGGGLASSLVGNILERGFGHTDYGDRFGRIINMTVVTPQGHIIRTGFNGQHASASNTYRYGTGPVIDGLFSQSNFGIVTEMTIELMPKPEKTCMFIVTVKNENQLGNIADAIRELKLSGAVHSAVHIANKSRATGSENTSMAGAWNLSGSVSGPSALVSSRKKAVRRIFKKHCQVITIWFIDDFMIRAARWIHDHIKPFSLYQPLKDAYDLQLGIPTDNPLKVLFNDSSLQSATLNTSAYQTCFSWVNAVCAAEKTEIEKLYAVTRKAFEKAGYEFRITFTAVNARSLIMIANTTYARNESEIMKAAQFSKDLHETLRQHGFLPYRAGSGSYDKIPEPSPEYMNLLKSLKNAFDPKGILAPGKYRIS